MHSKTRTIYPGSYSKLGKIVLAERLNISMDVLEDSIAIYRLNHSHYEVVAHGHYGEDIIDDLTKMVAERSNN